MAKLINLDDIFFEKERDPIEGVFYYVRKSYLEALPEADAIPTKWILEWSAAHMEYGTVSIEEMLKDWRKEKENYVKSV